MSANKNSFSKRRVFLPIFIIAFVFLLVVAIVFTVMIFTSLFEVNIKKNGRKVGADVVSIIFIGNYYDGTVGWGLDYYYKDENGFEYYGMVKKYSFTQEQAQNEIGKQVEIYIDGKGNSVLDVDDYKPLRAIIFSVLSYGGVAAILFICVLPHKRLTRSEYSGF